MYNGLCENFLRRVVPLAKGRGTLPAQLGANPARLWVRHNPNMKTLKLPVLFFTLATLPACAVSIANWTFETSVQTPALVDPNATASSFTLSSGSISYVSGNAPSATTAISGTGWNVADGVKWWEFTVTANPGYAVNLDSLTFDDRASSTGPTSWSVTVNGISAVSGQSTHQAFSSSPMNTVSLSGLVFQGLNSANVKIFGFGASGSTGTWRIDNVTLSGTLIPSQAVPETLTPAFTAIALVGFVIIASRLWSANMQPVRVKSPKR